MPMNEVTCKPPKNNVLPKSYKWVPHKPKACPNPKRIYAPKTRFMEYFFAR